MGNAMPILYSIGCPKCEVLSRKLKDARIAYQLCNSLAEMANLGINEVPVLFADGVMMNFAEAIEWVNEHKNVTEE